MNSKQPEDDGQGGAPPNKISLYAVDSNDPHKRLIDRADVSPEDIEQINDLMQAMGDLREAENHLNDASLEYMKLGKTDMRALHLLIVSEHQEQVVTASMLAAHLNITSASTTKLLDRLERGGHIVRTPHPSDRRSQAISITRETHASAVETVGAQQSRRFYAAARLTREEREVVIRFLRDTAAELRTGMEWSK
ncbi:putative transcriptional regulator, MarR family protein [Corynebacterium maris DSM 45190]|uniref:Putative transcriptional regulator, MarR family protein n=1 Tax=Corynebacterium maris DSM 45190 TaxID=1224163 RepID=S5STJ0_9CORY|nr:MarR family transcriptional regulator [Corynebacterium maris]AGS34464.1 putative transcriptional regulator, MarR family protein [Corynebacterium maris DSM 45190]